METTNIFKRRSVRTFKNQSISQQDIQYLCYAGLVAPSATNQQPWHIIAVTNKQLIEQLSTTSPYGKFAAKAPLIIVVAKCIDTATLRAPGYVDIDCAIASENILLAAVDLGLGGTWIGTCPQVERMQAVDKVIKMPQGYSAFSLLAIGYPENEPMPHDNIDESKITTIE